MDPSKSTITLTFGDMAENHVGMEQIGARVAKGQGVHLADLKAILLTCKSAGIAAKLHVLNGPGQATAAPAYLLIIKKGVDALLGSGSTAALFAEQAALDHDKKALMYKRVCNKKARWNLCFSEEGHPPCYEEGKGRVVAYDDVPLTRALHAALPSWFGPKAEGLQCEGNYYYDASSCGIGYHGDTERRRVFAVRLGATIPICFQWFQRGEPVGRRLQFDVEDGDIYIMSEKTVGTDWKSRIEPTLRHAAGAATFTHV
jgi:hypothetical protein